MVSRLDRQPATFRPITGPRNAAADEIAQAGRMHVLPRQTSGETWLATLNSHGSLRIRWMLSAAADLLCDSIDLSAL